MSITVRSLEAGDLASVARIHKHSYRGDHFSSRLTPQMLSAFYGEILQQNEYAYVAVDDTQRVLGFIIGGSSTGAAVKTFVRHNLVALTAIVIRTPELIPSRLAAFCQKIFSRTNGTGPGTSVRLLSIAVDPHAQSAGIGRALITKFEAELMKDRVGEYGLSVRKDNANAVKFYEKNGFRLESVVGTSAYYVKALS